MSSKKSDSLYTSNIPLLPLTPPSSTPTTSLESNVYYRSPYGPRKRTPLHFSGAGRTKQSFKDECDVNRIMARYKATGILPQSGKIGQFGDVTGLDFQRAQDLVVAAKADFQTLPADLRARFGNSPAAFLDFAADPANHPELEQLGLLEKAPEAPSSVTATPPAPPPAKTAPRPSSEAGEAAGKEAKPTPPAAS